MARALYIHWPFCIAKCPYCDFNSHVRASVDHSAWQAALIADLRAEAAADSRQPLTSIFFGGGTPSLMPPALVAALLAEAERLWGIAPGIEITLEANPSSVEAARFADLAAAGVNRVSLGIQALDDGALRRLGRAHDVGSALAALDAAQTHFGRVSIDLIYARPGQTEADWEAELRRALSFGTEHLSLYQLTIEPGTRFASDFRAGALVPMADDPAADLFALTRATTSAAGCPAYEVSNHAVPGAESRHNLAYWRYDDTLGIGPGAHARRAGVATIRHKKPENWLAAVRATGHGIAESRVLSRAEMAAEAMLMGLRLAKGVDVARMSARLGVAADALVDARRLAFYVEHGLAWRAGARIGATEAGMAVLNTLIAELVPDAPAMARA